ncbi:MAG: ribosome small subunit-dependent GTPase A [Myxococcota bacterium]
MSAASPPSGLDRWGRLPSDVPSHDRDLELGRVLYIERGRHLVGLHDGDRLCSLAGSVEGEAGLAVGDWVQLRGSQTVRVLPRRSWLVRKRIQRSSSTQLVAANLEHVFIVTAVGADLSPRRVERFVALVRSGGAEPVLVLNKTDLPFELDRTMAELREAAPSVPLCLVSGKRENLEDLRAHLAPKDTVALVGSSGVGKSTLVNALCGAEVQATGEVRAGDDKGRHTTTRRELIPLPSGALLIDTPGIREVGLIGDKASVLSAFSDVASIALTCRFSDCRHQNEPGCGIQAALDSGELSESRWRSFQRLREEAAAQARRRKPDSARGDKPRTRKAHSGTRWSKKVDP